MLVQAGLTPVQALQAATLNPARFLGREKDLGTVATGKLADLVLLDANPLDDISNTRKIAAVIYGGTVYQRAELDGMLRKIEAIASRIPISDVLRKTIQERNADAAVQQYRDLRAAQPNAYDFSENELISLGYQLLGEKKSTDAVAIFRLSTEIYPQSYNTWDSLAEAYMDHGDKDLAIENYKKSLQLNPENTNAKEKVRELAAP